VYTRPGMPGHYIADPARYVKRTGPIEIDDVKCAPNACDGGNPLLSG
jgi:hypothetical protein